MPKANNDNTKKSLFIPASLLCAKRFPKINNPIPANAILVFTPGKKTVSIGKK